MAEAIRRYFSPWAAKGWAVFMLILVNSAPGPVAAQQQDLSIGRSTGLPIPRFVSLSPRRGEANVRYGPGKQYPINWVFTRSGIPLEVIAEFDNWRKIKDYEGAEGWVSVQLLSSERTIMIQGAVRDLRRTADNQARVLLRVEPEVIGSLLECHESWCRVEIEGRRGWLQRSEFWGSLPGEIVP